MSHIPYVLIVFGAVDVPEIQSKQTKTNMLLTPGRNHIIVHTFQWSFEDEVIRNTIETNEKHTYHDK